MDHGNDYTIADVSMLGWARRTMHLERSMLYCDPVQPGRTQGAARPLGMADRDAHGRALGKTLHEPSAGNPRPPNTPTGGLAFSSRMGSPPRQSPKGRYFKMAPGPGDG